MTTIEAAATRLENIKDRIVEVLVLQSASADDAAYAAVKAAIEVLMHEHDESFAKAKSRLRGVVSFFAEASFSATPDPGRVSDEALDTVEKLARSADACQPYPRRNAT